MSTRLQLVTASSVTAVIITGAFAYGVQLGFISALTHFPDEPVRSILVSTHSKADAIQDAAGHKTQQINFHRN